jgi:SAM-dependent methyltransferase
MTPPTDYPFVRYLAAKQTVDDRALNPHVLAALRAALAGHGARPLAVLEVGAGIGTMIERLLAWGVVVDADYTALDASAEAIAALRERLPAWATARGGRAAVGGDAIALQLPAARAVVRPVVGDLFAFAARWRGQRRWDLLVASAVLDLVDPRAALAALLPLLAPGGLAYLAINFDGLTVFEPTRDPTFDARLMALYAQSIDRPRHEPRERGDSHAGRHLFGYLRALGAEIVAAGSSDWVVLPAAGGYPADEAFFLHWVVHQFARALREHPAVVPADLAAWVARRHAQIEAGELLYVAHQLDYLARVPGR